MLSGGGSEGVDFLSLTADNKVNVLRCLATVELSSSAACTNTKSISGRVGLLVVVVGGAGGCLCKQGRTTEVIVTPKYIFTQVSFHASTEPACYKTR